MTRLPNCLLAILATLFLTQHAAPVWAQIRVRSVTASLLSGHESDVTLKPMEPGRVYLVHLSFFSSYSLFEPAWIEGEMPGADRIRLDDSNPSAEIPFTPTTPDGVRLRLSAGGAIGSTSEVKVEWRPFPVNRMPRAQWIESPNQGQRPPGATVDAVVVHATVTPTLEATVDWFLTPRSQVSAHYVVGRDGKIVQMVEDSARAWHAGVSELEGVKGVNDLSVGIEIVNFNDGKDPFTDAQYEAVAAIIRHLREQYSIPDSRIVSHEHVARPPGRKSDPRGFDFPRLLKLAASH